MDETKRAKIALEDGRIFEGFSFGAEGERRGEVVFNTSMAGYQEILTDPSYKGQLVAMTYPLIGNYGVNEEDVESRKPFAEGFIVKECSRIASNWRSRKGLDEYLKENGVVGIEGIDTRALTRHIRLKGAMKAVLSTVDLDIKSLVKKAKNSPGLIGRDLVKEVTCEQTYETTDYRLQTTDQRPPAYAKASSFAKASAGRQTGEEKHKVVVLDCGVKFNILRELTKNNCSVTVVPARTKAEEILKMKPDGVLLSNGPGDPAAVPYVVETVKKMIGKIPIFGICLGHQMLGLALGGRTYKLKFGHHGGNHPVKDLQSGKVAITVQNHGFCVDAKEKPEIKVQKPENKYYMVGNEDVEITHMNLNDNTLEGMRHKRLPIFSVQFHPEAGPGPNDAKYLFGEFVEMMKKNH